MPLYDFICNECGETNEFFLRMEQERPIDCPICGCSSCLRRDFSGINVGVEISKPKSFGDIADSNTEKLVNEGKLDKKVLDWESKKKKKKEAVSKMSEIASMTPTQKRNYIMTGKKNG